jgi:hypothetical protein
MEFFRYRTQPPTASLQAAGEVAGPPDDREAFEKGFRQGRLAEGDQHHGHPMLKLAVFAVAAGAAVLALAADEGSFSKGGAVVDQKIAVAADTVQVGAADAAAKAGQAIKDAGDRLGQTLSDAANKR